jgi:iron complex outermembrane recepter protein
MSPKKWGDVSLCHTVLYLSKQINPRRAGITIMRIATVVAVALFTSGGLTAAERADASMTQYELNIPRQPLDAALKDLAQQTGVQVGRFSDAVKGDTLVGPVTGNYSAEAALKTLLAPTKLTYRALNDRAIIVLRPEDVAQLPAANTRSTSGENDANSDGDEKKSFWSRLRLAQTTQGGAQSTNSVNSSSRPSSQSLATSSQEDAEPVRLEEIIVTASKREERLSQVGVGISVVTGEQLDTLAANGLED